MMAGSSGKQAADPRAKLVIMLCTSGSAVFVSDILCQGALLLFASVCAGAFRPDLRKAALFIRVMLSVMLPLFVVQCVFTRGGEPVLKIGEVTLVTVAGLAAAVLMLLRMCTFVVSGVMLTTSSPRDYLLAMMQCRVPYELAFMAMMSIHFIPLLSAEASNMKSTAQMKGIELEKGSLRQKLSVYIHMILPILSRTLQRADAMSCAMQVRGFRSHPERTCMRQLELTGRDWMVIAGTPVITAGILAFVHL